MENILGLHLIELPWGDSISDRFVGLVSKNLDAAEESDRSNLDAYERRGDIIMGGRDKAYVECLKKLAKEDSGFKELEEKVEKRIKTKQWLWVPERTKKIIQAGLWEKLGNEIPIGEVDEVRAMRELKERGYEFRKIKGGSGWYYNEERLAKDWRKIFSKLEDIDFKDYI